MSERGIKKWAPYKSLLEQEKYLKKLHEDNQKVERPLISEDEAQEINEILVNYQGEELEITYWRSERINTIISVIKKIDPNNKKIVLPERRAIYFNELVSLTKIR